MIRSRGWSRFCAAARRLVWRKEKRDIAGAYRDDSDHPPWVRDRAVLKELKF